MHVRDGNDKLIAPVHERKIPLRYQHLVSGIELASLCMTSILCVKLACIKVAISGCDAMYFNGNLVLMIQISIWLCHFKHNPDQ